MTAVLVMPVKSMLPHGNADFGTGLPRLVLQATLPSAADNATTESPSVTTNTR